MIVNGCIDLNEFTWPEMTSRLANAHIGRLAYEATDGPRVVLIAVTGDRQGRIVFCTEDDPHLVDLDATTVAVEVDGGTDAIEHHGRHGPRRNGQPCVRHAASRPPGPSPTRDRTVDRRRTAHAHRSS